MPIKKMRGSLRDEITNIIKALNQPRYLLEPDQAEWLKYILDTTFSPLTAHLKNPNTLIPKFRKLIETLLFGLVRLFVQPEWVVKKDTKIEELLTMLSDRLKQESCIGSVQSTEELVKWFLSQSEKIGIPALGYGWEEPLEMKGEDISIAPLNDLQDDIATVDKAKDVLIDALCQFSVDIEDDALTGKGEDKQIGAEINRENWDVVLKLCIARWRSDKKNLVTYFSWELDYHLCMC